MSKKEKKEVKEILFTNEQAEKMLKLLNCDNDKNTKTKPNIIRTNLEKVVQAFFNLIITLFTLKDTGKWISVASLMIVFIMFFKFLKTNSYSIESMTLIAPYLGQIAIVVFSVIGGVKGAQSIVDKVIEHKSLIKTVVDKMDKDEKN
jgi:hypothetical protein